MSQARQTVIEVFFTGLMAFHRQENGRIGVGIHRSNEEHSLLITMREHGKPETRPDYPLVVHKGPLSSDLSLGVDRGARDVNGGFDPSRLKIVVFDGPGFHNRRLSPRSDVLKPQLYIEGAKFRAQSRMADVIHRRSRESREVALVVTAEIRLEGESRALLKRGTDIHTFYNDGRSYEIWVTNLPDLWQLDSSQGSRPSDFQHYYHAFPEIEEDDRYDLVAANTSQFENTYERPCLPIFLERSEI